jgi:hypothetical protein
VVYRPSYAMFEYKVFNSALLARFA